MTDRDYKILCADPRRYEEIMWKRYLRREIFEALLGKSKNTYKISRFKKVFEILNFDLFKAQKEELKNIKKGLAGENYKIEKIILPEIIENAFFGRNIYIIQGIEVECIIPPMIMPDGSQFKNFISTNNDRIVVKTFSKKKALKVIKRLQNNGYQNDNYIRNNEKAEVSIRFHKITAEDKTQQLEEQEIVNKCNKARYKAINKFLKQVEKENRVKKYYITLLKNIKNNFQLEYNCSNRKDYIESIDLIKKAKDPINVLKY